MILNSLCPEVGGFGSGAAVPQIDFSVAIYPEVRRTPFRFGTNLEMYLSE
jgi:hypothetical protein